MSSKLLAGGINVSFVFSRQSLFVTCLSCCPETGSFQKLSSLHCSRDPAPAQGTMENSECPFLCACGLCTHRTMFLKTFIFCKTAALENGDEQIWGIRRALSSAFYSQTLNFLGTCLQNLIMSASQPIKNQSWKRS